MEIMLDPYIGDSGKDVTMRRDHIGIRNSTQVSSDELVRLAGPGVGEPYRHLRNRNVPKRFQLGLLAKYGKRRFGSDGADGMSEGKSKGSERGRCLFAVRRGDLTVVRSFKFCLRKSGGGKWRVKLLVGLVNDIGDVQSCMVRPEDFRRVLINGGEGGVVRGRSGEIVGGSNGVELGRIERNAVYIVRLPHLEDAKNPKLLGLLNGSNGLISLRLVGTVLIEDSGKG